MAFRATVQGDLTDARHAVHLDQDGRRDSGQHRPLRPAHAGRPHPLTYVTNHGDRRLEEISNAALISIGKLLSGEENFMTEKFHPYLSLDLLLEDAPSSRIDLGALPELAHSMIGGNE